MYVYPLTMSTLRCVLDTFRSSLYVSQYHIEYRCLVCVSSSNQIEQSCSAFLNTIVQTAAFVAN